MAKILRLITLTPGQQAPEGCSGLSYNNGIVWVGEPGTLSEEYASEEFPFDGYKLLTKIQQMNTEVNAYINSHYDTGTQRSLNAIYAKQNTPANIKSYLDPVWDWISAIMVYYYGKKTEMEEAATVEDFELITWDFNQFTATKPNVGLRELMGLIS